MESSDQHCVIHLVELSLEQELDPSKGGWAMLGTTCELNGMRTSSQSLGFAGLI